MPISIFLKNKKKRIESKFHQVAKRIESKYELIHRKLTSKFHRESTETELIRSKIHNLIAKSTESIESIESKIKSEGFIPVFSRTSFENVDKFYPGILDWIQGRFLGQVVRMIVREGKIVEKVFLSPKGNRIFVKRSELEIWLRSMPTIQIKLRLRFRSMPTVLLNLRPLAVQ